MGGVLHTLFGGGSNSSTQTSNSSNQAFGPLSNLLTGNIGQGNSAMAHIANLLGVGGTPAEQGQAGDAYKNYLNSSGYQSMLDSGSKAITGNAAASGLLRSGATLKGLTKYGTDLASQKFDNYLGQLTGLGNYGLNSAGTIAGAGGVSSSSGVSKGSNSTGIINSLFG